MRTCKVWLVSRAGSTVWYGTKLRYGMVFFGLWVRYEITVWYFFPGTVWYEITLFLSYPFGTFRNLFVMIKRKGLLRSNPAEQNLSFCFLEDSVNPRILFISWPVSSACQPYSLKASTQVWKGLQIPFNRFIITMVRQYLFWNLGALLTFTCIYAYFYFVFVSLFSPFCCLMFSALSSQ